VTAVQVFVPVEEGIQIFQRTLKPVLIVRGEAEAVRRFFAARPDQKIVAMGTLSRDVVLGSVEVEEATKTGTGAAGDTPVTPPE